MKGAGGFKAAINEKRGVYAVPHEINDASTTTNDENGLLVAFRDFDKPADLSTRVKG